MIRTVTTYSGESEFARAAQAHALEIAKCVKARLKLVALWEGGANETDAARVDSARGLAAQSLNEIKSEAQSAGVPVVESERGEGMEDALISEARETDLLVLGLPTRAALSDSSNSTDLVRHGLQVIRKAPCAVLVVNEPPSALRRILVCYDDTLAGKALLRMAGALAECFGSDVGILTVENDIVLATELAASAQEYLAGYKIPSVEVCAEAGPPNSVTRMIKTAESFKADMIALGDEGHSLLERFFGADLAERAALDLSTPLLIAR